MKIKKFFTATLLTASLCLTTAFLSNKEILIKVCSWNIRDFGNSKDSSEIDFIAETLKQYDVVLIQEVVAGEGGGQAVARLNDALNRKGTKWDYKISPPTFGNSYKQERYAFLWKTSFIKMMGNPWLEQPYKLLIDREPYYGTFIKNGKEFTLANFHAITKAKQPETEVKYFKFLPTQYPKFTLIFCGDFNLPQNHTVFNPLKSMGYLPVLVNQKTTLKKECIRDECLASEFDNAFYPKSKLTIRKKGIIPFYKSFSSLKEANNISDHVPFYFEFSFN